MIRSRNYIPANDGYTLQGFVDAEPGMAEAVRFSYRPISAEKQASYNALLTSLKDTTNNPAVFRKRAEILKERLVSWDAKDNGGQLLPLTVASIRSLSPELFWRVFGIVYGTMATDIDPNWADDQQDEECKLATEADASNTEVGKAREASDSKN